MLIFIFPGNNTILMDLYVLRHGKAEPAGSGIDDDKRALTGKGKGEISRLAEWLLRRDERVDLIITSPRKRAVETAEIVARGLTIKEGVQVSDALSSGYNPDRLSHEIASVQHHGNIMIVGHEPDLSGFISCVISGNPDTALTMAKGGLAKIRDFQPGERPSGELLWLVSPDLIKGCR